MIHANDRRGTGQLIFGATLLIVGTLFLLNNLGVDVPNLFRFWPLILVAVGVGKCRDEGWSRSFWGNALIAIGILLQLSQLGIFHFNPFNLWPLILIAIGIRIVKQAVVGPTPPRPSTFPQTGEGWLNEAAAFGGGERKLVVPDFKGGEVTVAFGGFDIDLTECAIQGDQAVIHVTAAFGGVDLKVPTGWNVSMKVLPIFGGADDRTSHPPAQVDPLVPQLIVMGYVMFGGVEVKN